MKQIAQALVKAQKGFSPALKTSTNPHFRSRYADLATCVEAVIDSLNDNGIALMQMTHECSDGVIVETVFMHESGETFSAGRLHVPAAKHDPQGYGSALTYARRYSLMAAAGIAPEDDDGTAASKPKPVETKPVEPKPVEPKPKVETKKEFNKEEMQFIIDMFKTFLPDAKTEAQLKAFWSDNKANVQIVKDADEGAYIQLLADFKARKDQIIKEKA